MSGAGTRGGGRRAARWAGFLVLWGLVGFVLGTATLLGPVRWVTRVVRWLGAGATLESVAVNGIIVAFVLVSFLVAWYLGRWIGRADGAAVRVGVPAGTAALAAGALWLWLTPGAMTSAGPPPREPEAPFTIGPYPDARRMAQLRAAGYTGVISLLHPAVVPFEPRLLDREREAARGEGLEFIHAPMLPWVSGNQEAIDTLLAVARRDSGSYYVHCYLGRDRVRVAARALREAGVRVADRTGEDGGQYSLARRESLYRGPVHALPDDIYVIPLPDRQEYFSHVLNGGVRSVVSVLDPVTSGEEGRIRREEGWLEDYGLSIEYRHRPVPLFPADPCRLEALAREIRSLPRPVAVHGLDTDFTRSKMVLRALRGQPVYPEDFARGDVIYVGDSIYAGPAPVGDEVEDYLAAGGVATVVSLRTSAEGPEPAYGEEGPRLVRIPRAAGSGEGDGDAAGAARRIMALPKPVYVHGDRTPEARLAAVVEALRRAGVSPRCELPGTGRPPETPPAEPASPAIP